MRLPGPSAVKLSLNRFLAPHKAANDQAAATTAAAVVRSLVSLLAETKKAAARRRRLSSSSSLFASSKHEVKVESATRLKRRMCELSLAKASGVALCVSAN